MMLASNNPVSVLMELINLQMLQMFILPEEAAFVAMTSRHVHKALSEQIKRIPSEIKRLRELIIEAHPPAVEILALRKRIPWPKWTGVFGPNTRKNFLNLRVNHSETVANQTTMRILFNVWEAFYRWGITVRQDGSHLLYFANAHPIHTNLTRASGPISNRVEQVLDP